MFNISEFKSRLDKHGGPARKNLFLVEFAPTNLPIKSISTDDLRFFCQTVSMPGINLEVAPYIQNGVGYAEFMPTNSTPDQMNAVFLLDSNHNILSFFHRWINSVVNVSGSAGTSVSGLRRREINYKSDYVTSMTVRYFSTDNSKRYYECRYDGVYPTQVSAMDLSWSDNDSPATLTVNFSYNRIFYSGFFDTDDSSASSVFKGIPKYSLGLSDDITQLIQDFDQTIIDASALNI